MIFEISESIYGEVMFVEQKFDQAGMAALNMENCGFNNFALACADGYENAIVFLNDSK